MNLTEQFFFHPRCTRDEVEIIFEQYYLSERLKGGFPPSSGKKISQRKVNKELNLRCINVVTDEWALGRDTGEMNRII